MHATEHAEADAFFCFAKLMAEIGDNYTRKLDFSKVGIGAAMDKMMHLLERKDKKLHKNLVIQSFMGVGTGGGAWVRGYSCFFLAQ